MTRTLYLQSDAPLQAFPEACLSLTPKLSSPNANAVFLDIGATQRFFGGEQQILRNASELWQSFGLRPQVAVTDRPEWAAPLALGPVQIIPEGQSYQALLQLPIDRLRLCGDPCSVRQEAREREKLVAFMKRVGMHFIGDFTALNLRAIHRRFGKMGGSLREWVEGEREFLLPTFFPEEAICEVVDTEDLPSKEALLFALQQPLNRIEARLVGRQELAKTLRFRFCLESHSPFYRELHLSEPSRGSFALTRVIREFLAKLEWSSPLQRLEIEVTEAIAFEAGQLSLLDKQENRFADMGLFVNRLQARFGEEAVGFADLKESYLPEQNWEVKWPPAPPVDVPECLPERPPFLFTQPRPISIPPSGRLHSSENVAAQWWEGEEERRYYILEMPSGERWWVFWKLKEKRWYLHGSFD